MNGDFANCTEGSGLNSLGIFYEMTVTVIPRDDPRQALRVRRTLLAIGMAGVHLLICWAAYNCGLLRLSLVGFILFTAALWVGHFAFYFVIRTGLNKRFRDPSLTFAQIMWTATCIVLTAYLLNGLRPVVLMLFLVGMLFGFFRLNFREFIYLGLYAAILYGIAIGLLCRFHPEALDLNREVIIWFSFCLVIFCFALMGREISHMRESLRQQNVHLRDEIRGRQKAQEEMQFRKAYFEGLVNNMPDSIAIFNDQGTITEINSQFERMFGYSEKEALGQNISELMAPPDRLEEARSYRRRTTLGETIDVETVRKRKGGSLIDVSLRSASVMVGNARVGDFVIYRDITPRKQAEKQRARLETQLHQSRKMEAIATLAGGIAHKFNNALTTIVGNIELLQMRYDEDEDTSITLREMKESGHHMAHLTSQLLAYARGGKYNARTMPLREFVQDTLPMVMPMLNPGVRLDVDLPDSTMKVRIDPTQMQMVLTAIVANSNDAIQGDGHIVISIKDVELDEGFAKEHSEMRPGNHVSLVVEDDGKGMDEKTKSRIFEPFFTTHFIGRGLGMAAVYGIVTNHGGSITVDSKPGEGTTVRIYLPALSEDRTEQQAEILDDREIEPARGQETILVIEDEELVMDLTRTVLKRLGYRVLEAETGRKALEMTRSFTGQIDLALLDIKLPDMTGIEVFSQIKKDRPDLKVVVCSGYAVDGPVQDILDAGADGFIQKPFSLSLLSQKLAAVLDTK